MSHCHSFTLFPEKEDPWVIFCKDFTRIWVGLLMTHNINFKRTDNRRTERTLAYVHTCLFTIAIFTWNIIYNGDRKFTNWHMYDLRMLHGHLFRLKCLILLYCLVDYYLSPHIMVKLNNASKCPEGDDLMVKWLLSSSQSHQTENLHASKEQQLLAIKECKTQWLGYFSVQFRNILCNAINNLKKITRCIYYVISFGGRFPKTACTWHK